jgi:hypothetical protein
VGVLTEYFIARDDADAARAHTSPTGPKLAGFETTEWKSIDPVVCLAMLDEVVTGRNALEWIKSKPPDSTVAGSADDEHWVFRVYEHHVEVLAGLTDDQLPQVAERWAASEELRGWPVSDVRDALSDLVRLARGAPSFCETPLLLGILVDIERMIYR